MATSVHTGTVSKSFKMQWTHVKLCIKNMIVLCLKRLQQNSL